jgi:hypothetical protein
LRTDSCAVRKIHRNDLTEFVTIPVHPRHPSAADGAASSARDGPTLPSTPSGRSGQLATPCWRDPLGLSFDALVGIAVTSRCRETATTVASELRVRDTSEFGIAALPVPLSGRTSAKAPGGSSWRRPGETKLDHARRSGTCSSGSGLVAAVFGEELVDIALRLSFVLAVWVLVVPSTFGGESSRAPW